MSVPVREFRVEWEDCCDVKHSETRNTRDHGPKEQIIAKFAGAIGPLWPVALNGIRGRFRIEDAGAFFEATLA